jgi:hypothetical protein
MKDRKGYLILFNCGWKNILKEPTMDMVHYWFQPSFDPIFADSDYYVRGCTSLTDAIEIAKEAKRREYRIELYEGEPLPGVMRRLHRGQVSRIRNALKASDSGSY